MKETTKPNDKLNKQTEIIMGQLIKKTDKKRINNNKNFRNYFYRL